MSGLPHYMSGLIQPFDTLWFIYLLALFFVIVKVARNIPPIVMFSLGAVLEMLPIETGSILIDESAGRFVYFYFGYWMAKRVFRYAENIGALDRAICRALPCHLGNIRGDHGEQWYRANAGY